MKILSYDDVEKIIRALSKGNYYQNLYNCAKELNFKIFKNDTDLTSLQVIFLGYLTFYNNLFTDIFLDEVSDIVLKDEIYEDSYTYYKKKVKPIDDSTLLKDKRTENIPKTDTWVFNRNRRK